MQYRSISFFILHNADKYFFFGGGGEVLITKGKRTPYTNQNTELYDFLSLDRPIKGIKGMTREVILAVTTNSQEFRWHYREAKRFPQEHPSAGSTDVVEGIIAFFMSF